MFEEIGLTLKSLYSEHSRRYNVSIFRVLNLIGKELSRIPLVHLKSGSTNVPRRRTNCGKSAKSWVFRAKMMLKSKMDDVWGPGMDAEWIWNESGWTAMARIAGERFQPTVWLQNHVIFSNDWQMDVVNRLFHEVRVKTPGDNPCKYGSGFC